MLIDLSRPTGNWIIFTGDQLGSLFADRILESYKSSGYPMEKLAMVASTVSSKMLGAMAKAEGFRFVECLTGNVMYLVYEQLCLTMLSRFQVYREHCFGPGQRRF